MAAGVAALKELTPDVYEQLNRGGARVKDQLSEVFASPVSGMTTGTSRTDPSVGRW